MWAIGILVAADALGFEPDALVRGSGLRRGVALALTVAVLVGAAGAATLALWPSVSDQTEQLAKELPAALGELRAWFEQREWGRWLLGRVEPERRADGPELVSRAAGVLVGTTGVLARFSSSWSSGCTSLHSRISISEACVVSCPLPEGTGPMPY